MTHALVLLLALVIGVVAGLRAFTAPAVLAWAALLEWINLSGTWAQWMAHPVTVGMLTVIAVAELVSDKVPTMPSRKSAPQFLVRIATGAFADAPRQEAMDTSIISSDTKAADPAHSLVG